MLVFIIGLAVIAALIIYSLIENCFIKTVHYHMCISNSGNVAIYSGIQDDVKQLISIVQLSDLHNCSYGNENQRLLKKIKSCKPDIILLTGDMINKYQSIPHAQFLFFEQIAKLCPCIYSFGNHELKQRERYPKCFEEYIEKIKKYGIIIADNEMNRFVINGISCCVAAYSSDLSLYKKSCLKSSNQLSDVGTLPECDNSSIGILLSHDPDLAELYKASNYPLVFSGHLHGGIVRVPGYRGVISTRFVLFPKYDGGCYQLDCKHVMVVSRGLGSHTIKFRLFNRPELVHTTVNKY